MWNIPFKDKDKHKPYRPPEMAGPPVVGPSANDDVIKQPATMAALLIAAVLILGFGILAYGLYGPGPTTLDIADILGGGAPE